MASQIPPAFIDDLLARSDIVTLIDERIPLKKKGKDYLAVCPFHDEKTPSFSVSPSKQFYYCFGCGASGSALGFLIEYDRLDFLTAVDELAARVGMQVPRDEHTDGKRDNLSPIYDQLQRAQEFYSKALRDHSAATKAVDYLKKRGLSGKVAAQFGIGYAPPGWDNLVKMFGKDKMSRQTLLKAGLVLEKDGGQGAYDRFRDRITFPIHDHRGRVIAFGGRVLGDEEPKYLNSPETPVFHKSRELYGLHLARKSTRELKRLLVVEGYMDVVGLAQFGVTDVVATLGTATTSEHLERLFRVVAEVVFCFDGDVAGQRAAKRAMNTCLPLLSDGRSVGFLFLPADHDPDSMVRAEGPGAFRNPEKITPLSTFLFESLSREVSMDSIDGRARLVDLSRPLLRKLPPSAFRTLMLKRLAELARLEYLEVAAHIDGTTEITTPTSPAPVRERRQSPSLVRQAISILLHHPKLALSVPDPAELKSIEQPGASLLVEMLELILATPDIAGGAIVEHWRGTEHSTHLSKLLATELPIPEEGLTSEFLGTVERLRQQRLHARKDVLSKALPSELSEAEKTELRTALQEAKSRDNIN